MLIVDDEGLRAAALALEVGDDRADGCDERAQGSRGLPSVRSEDPAAPASVASDPKTATGPNCFISKPESG
jgi:hypothetical protein